MLKKIISFLLVVTLILTFAGCGSSTKGSKDDVSSKEQTSSKDESMVSSTSSENQSSETSSVTSSTTSTPQKDNTLWTRKMVALTFDDSPYIDTTTLLDLLKEKNVKATFFMIGKRMEQHPDIVSRAIEEGHDVGWHSYNHDLNVSSTQSMVAADFDMAISIMQGIDPNYQITLYRGPGGSASDVMKQEAAARNWRLVNWTNYGFDDSKTATITPEERMMGVYSTSNGPNLRNGEVLLIHPYEGITGTITGIGLLIDKLRADGYEPVQMSELLKRRNGGKAGTLYGNVPLY